VLVAHALEATGLQRGAAQGSHTSCRQRLGRVLSSCMELAGMCSGKQPRPCLKDAGCCSRAGAPTNHMRLRACPCTCTLHAPAHAPYIRLRACPCTCTLRALAHAPYMRLLGARAPACISNI